MANKTARTENPVILSFPSGHAMSSSRLFLSGLLSSRARLRFADLCILSFQNTSRYKSTRIASQLSHHRASCDTAVTFA